jgi:nucleoside-diphosphate-sugar epimerase
VSRKHYLVTGGTGFMGSAIARRLVRDGHRVRVFDNNSRGSERRLADVRNDIELIVGDIRDPERVASAIRGIDGVHHLAFVNGTEYFYTAPDLVLEVAVKGICNVIDGCLKHGVGSLFLASSSEVYQAAAKIPTDETTPLSVPDPANPRFSYGGGKIASELMAINFGRKHFERVVIYRPHNIYGPDMGTEHVIPQFAIRLRELTASQRTGILPFAIQGSGEETRSFCFVDDLVDGVMLLQEHGEHLGIYHIGTMEEVPIADLARRVAKCFGREIEVIAGKLLAGSTPRRCPDIRKIAALGYSPRVSLNEGLPIVAGWYRDSPAPQPVHR